MKKFWMALMVAIMGITVVVSSAEAKRMGGGGSFGKSSPSYSRQAPAQSPGQSATAARPGQAAAPAPASPWRGIMGGALLGLGLGALLSHFGMGGELASMIGTALMIGLLAFAAIMLFRLMSRKTASQQPSPAYAGPMQKSAIPEVGSHLGSAHQPVNWQSGTAPAIPADFDSAGFLRHAKTNFLRMQAAWDKADTQDIREFTTPEMYAELKMQLTERGASANHTDVVTLNAELLGVETVAEEHLASVQFDGMVKEDDNAMAEPFKEIWVLSKPVTGNSGWLLAGIQQA
jgi:predicted lipid-binding transport protein (Tim44 family)